jgi:hypothetical protein
MARSSLSLALDLQVAAPKDEHSGGSRLPVERHDHAIALDRDTNLALGIVDALPPQKRLDIRFGSFDFLAPRDKATPHMDDPDVRVIIFALDAPDVEPGSGKEPRQLAMMTRLRLARKSFNAFGEVPRRFFGSFTAIRSKDGLMLAGDSP